jgi:opacity protein-like surface antigen
MIKKTKLALGIAAATLTMTGALVSPQAMAHSKAERVAEAASNKADALEAQLQNMQAELSRLRAQASRPASNVDAGKVQELDQWMNEVKAAPKVDSKKSHDDNMIFFRGGFARNDVKRNDLLTGNQFAGNALGGDQTNKDGWYIGAGFDFGLTEDMWGLMANTELMAEFGLDYRNFGAKNFKGAAPGAAPGTVGANPACTLINLAAVDTAGAPGLAGTGSCNGVTVSQLTVAASPKIKFMKGSAFRPWVIPFGLTINVVSPPSNGVTVLNPGMQFGTGAEYALWKAIKVGADVRYNLTGRSVDGVNTDGMTAGGYLGIGF